MFDPEDGDFPGELFINIETGDMGAREAFNKLDEIDKAWLAPVVGKDIGKFNLDI